MNPTPLIVASFVFCAASFATAQPEDRPRREPPKELVEQFDTDLDGELSKDERDLMREEFKLRAETYKLKMIARFDANADGELDKAERKAARQTVQSEMLEKYDADGDGKLSRGERTAGAAAEGLPPRQMLERSGKRGQRSARGERGQRGERGARGERGQRGERRTRGGDEMTLAGPGAQDCDKGDCPRRERGVRGERGERKQRGERTARQSRERRAGFDSDGDGKLSNQERRAARGQWKSQHKQMQAQRRVRDTVDADADGNIDTEELNSALERLRADDLSMDLNADGVVDEQDNLILIEKLMEQNAAPKAE